MDTKWTKFKESIFAKTLCIILACFLLVLSAKSGLQLARYYYCYPANQENAEFINSRVFDNLFSLDMEALSNAVASNQYQADFERARTEGADEFLRQYKEYKANYDMRVKYDDYLEEHTYEHVDYESFLEENALLNDNDDTTALQETTEANTVYYDNSSDDAAQETTTSVTFQYEELDDYSSDYFYGMIKMTVNDSDIYNVDLSVDCTQNYSDDYIKELFYDEFESDVGKVTETPESFYDRGIKNLLYYAEAEDGTVISNVESKEILTENAENKTYVFYENGKISQAGNLYRDYEQRIPSRSSAYNQNLYIVIDTAFSQEDHYSAVADHVTAAGQIDVQDCFARLIVFAVLALAFFIISVCLAGHKNGEIQTAFTDKVPNDIHLLISGGLITLAGAALCTYEYEYITYYYERLLGYMTDFPRFLIEKPWYPLISYALVVIMYLLAVEFFTSIARSIKAKNNIFKNTFIYIFFRFAVKSAAKCFKGIKNIVHSTVKGIVYKPVHFSRKTVATIALYTLFNILSVMIAWFFLFGINTGSGVFFGLLFTFGVLTLDGYIIYLVIKYLKSLDGIITAVENGEPVSENTDELPNSLKILANSYDIANANLQSAIVKAVKDERTKAELITNVSHDLKTPLTSVINYIDLLQKCSIEDETAKEYMAVIAEKSGKLKRLIEDLIEASKISSGNVSINKTKLNLNELATQAVVEETAEFEKRNLQLIFEEPANKHIAFADGTKIYRVFENLLSNAKKYSAPGSRVYARLYNDGTNECFELKNISKEQLNISAEELTERFVRGDKSRNEDGNGLGLSIATELCRLNDGRLDIAIDGDLFKATVIIPKD